MLRILPPMLVAMMAAAAVFSQTPPAAPAKPSSQASPQAPIEVEAALRARVTQFYRLEIEGKFNQALQLVAEDTKDLFVGSSKPTYQNFEIQSVTYLDNFTKAVVMTMVFRMLPIQGFMGHPVPTKMTTRWKIENGQWCYYIDPQKDLPATPFGRPGMPPVGGLPGAMPIATGGVPGGMPTATGSLPPSLPVPAGSLPPGLPIAAGSLPLGIPVAGGGAQGAGSGTPRPLPPMPTILTNPRALTYDKSSVQLKSSGPSTEQVTISDLTAWPVALTLLDPKVAGLTVKLDPLNLKPSEKAILKIESSGGDQTPKTPVTIVVTIQPTKQVIPIKVTFAK
jgi:hypothetical protein